ncbi:MAG: hypothetical protein FJ405_11650 [Verrucomicrobia bacterium]|nr:hypothetical protein [Verrucomicrobiota bacterium]
MEKLLEKPERRATLDSATHAPSSKVRPAQQGPGVGSRPSPAKVRRKSLISSLLFVGVVLLACAALVAALSMLRSSGWSGRPKAIDVRDSL